MIKANKLRQQISIGAMDKRIIIRNETVTLVNEFNEPTTVTNSDTTVWAYELVKQNEKQLEDDINDKQSVNEQRELIIRYLAGVTYQTKVVMSSSVYDIIGIDDTMGRRRFLKLTVKRVF